MKEELDKHFTRNTSMLFQSRNILVSSLLTVYERAGLIDSVRMYLFMLSGHGL
jgi:hypothetical protein